MLVLFSQILRNCHFSRNVSSLFSLAISADHLLQGCGAQGLVVMSTPFLQVTCMTSLWGLWARGTSSQVRVCGGSVTGNWPRHADVKSLLLVLRGKDKTSLSYSEDSSALGTQVAGVHCAAFVPWETCCSSGAAGGLVRRTLLPPSLPN